MGHGDRHTAGVDVARCEGEAFLTATDGLVCVDCWINETISYFETGNLISMVSQTFYNQGV